MMAWSTVYDDTALALDAGETAGQTLTLSICKSGQNKTRVVAKCTTSTLTGVYECIWQGFGNGTNPVIGDYSVSDHEISFETTWDTYPSSGTQLRFVAYRDPQGGSNIMGGTATNAEVTVECPSDKNNPELNIYRASVTLDASNEDTCHVGATTAAEYNGTIEYSSSNERVATVDNNGVVTSVCAGTAIITILAPETNTYTYSSKTLTVTVTGMRKKASNQGYGSLRLLDVDLYDWVGNFAGSNACGKVDLFVVTYGDKLIYKAVAKNGKTIENGQNYFCQLRTWNPDSTGILEHWALTRSQDLTTAYLLPNQATNAPGLSTYGNEILLTSYMVVYGCGARTIEGIPYTRGYINNYDKSDVTAPVLGTAIVTAGTDDITITFNSIPSEDVFYLIEDADHHKQYISFEPTFVLPKDGSGITYTYSCYAIDYNGNKSTAQIAEVNMPFSAVTNQALNRFHEAGYEPGNSSEVSDKALDGDEGTAWVTYPNRPASEEWIYVDLGTSYNLSEIAIVWGSNRSTKYILQVRDDAPSSAQMADDEAWTLLADTIKDAAVNSTKITEVSGHGRYVRFHALAKEGDCIRMKEFRVFAGSVYDPNAGEDTENPIISTASVSSYTHNSATIAVTASDDIGIVKINASDASKSYNQDVALDAGTITLTGLEEETSYTITLVAYDAMNKTSEPYVLDAFTTTSDPTIPQVAAPVPSGIGIVVRPIYSDAFSSILAHSFKADGWAGAPLMQKKNNGGDSCLVYNISSAYNEVIWGVYNDETKAISAKDGYHSASGYGVDASEMDSLHVDIWSLQSCTNALVIHINDADMKAPLLSHSGEGWQGYNIALSQFNLSDAEARRIDNVRWMKFTGIGFITGKMALDNVYFFKKSNDPTAIDNTIAGEKAVKVIENGQLVIIKNGVKYNVLGGQL